MSPALAIDVERRYPRGPTVAARLELPLDAAPVTVLFGASGSGKTTILRCLAGLDRPQRGSIRLGGETWFDAEAGTHVPPQRRRVGLLFQDHALFPHLRVAENVAFGLAGLPAAGREEAVGRVVRLLRLDGLLDRRPGELSGGQRQRVALARALAPRPRLLLLDEPLSALDAPSREELRGELRSVLVSAGVPSLVVTHDRIEALALGDRIAVLAEGSIRQVGPVPEVFGAPADLAVARAVGMENVLPARVVERGDGLAVAEVGPVRLVAVDPGHLGSDAYACVRAEEIVLEPPPGSATSARNRLPGVVLGLAPEGPLVRVTLDCRFRLVALVTRRSAEALALAPGARLEALVKAQAIRLVPRAGPA